MLNLSSRVYLLVWWMIFYLGGNELWAKIASGTSPTIAGSVYIKRFFRGRFERTADLPAKLNSSQLRRLGGAGGKGLRWLLLPTAYVLICRNSTQAVPAAVSQVVWRHMRTRLTPGCHVFVRESIP